jgi:hypothetical protein
MVGLRDTGIILVQAQGCPMSSLKECSICPRGACSRGYKLRSREGECLKSLSVVVSCECSVCVMLGSMIVQ